MLDACIRWCISSLSEVPQPSALLPFYWGRVTLRKNRPQKKSWVPTYSNLKLLEDLDTEFSGLESNPPEA